MTAEDKPGLVTWAFRLWYVSGGLYVVAAIVLTVIFANDRPAVVIPFGVVMLVIGGAIIALARKVDPADPRWRSALAAFTLVVVLLSMVGAVVGLVPVLYLLVGIVGLAGSLMAYRPAAEAWFTGKS